MVCIRKIPESQDNNCVDNTVISVIKNTTLFIVFHPSQLVQYKTPLSCGVFENCELPAKLLETLQVGSGAVE